MADWYIIHTASGAEKQVKRAIFDQVKKKHMQDLFEDIVIPIAEIPSIKRGKPVIFEKKFMPGYVLIKMCMTDDSWHLVKNVPKVIGFLGNKIKPEPLSNKGVNDIFAQLKVEEENLNSASTYMIGEEVLIVDGPFDTFTGVIENVDVANSILDVSVAIFGRTTLIKLNFSQVKKY